MKYTIEGFSQEYALSLCTYEDNKELRLDSLDLIILRYFVDFYPNTKKVEINGKQYAWLAYNKIVNDLPLLRMDKRAISRRLNKMCKLEILTCELLENNQTMFGFGPNYENLINSRAVINLQGLDLKVQPQGVSESTAPCTLEYSNISINNSINLNNEEKTKEINKEIFSGSETTRNTTSEVSLTEGERLTPYPLIEKFGQLISDFTPNKQIQNLLYDYLEVRIAKDPLLSTIQFKASLNTLKQAQRECQNAELLDQYTDDVINNAITGAYTIFKPIYTQEYKNTNSDRPLKISKPKPFGDCSTCIPAGPDLELALDDSGNPIKF